MSRKVLYGLCGLVLTFLVSPLSAEPRVWTDVQGRTISADYVRIDGDKVIVRLQNKNLANLPIEKLSAKDQEWLQNKRLQVPMGESGQVTGPSRPAIIGLNQADLDNMPKNWPKMVKPPGNIKVEVLEEDSAKNVYRYATQNFEFNCTCKLGTSAIKDLSEAFEGTLASVQAVPLPLRRQPSLHGKFQARIFETMDQYLAAGGPKGSAGVFMPSKDCIFVPVESIGLEKSGSTWKAKKGANLHVIIHELTHQLVNSNVQRDPWFLEGLAEYYACTHKNDGMFDFSSNKKAILDYVISFSKKTNRGRNLGKDVTIPKLSTFMQWEYSDFVNGMGTNDATVGRNYGVALLMLYWFMHGDNEAYKQRITDYLQVLAKSERFNSAALQEARKKLLPPGGDWAELEAEMKNGFKKFGVNLKFQ